MKSKESATLNQGNIQNEFSNNAALVELFTIREPESWAEDLGDVLDSMIFLMAHNSDRSYSQELWTVRQLQKSFIEISKNQNGK